MPDATKRRNAKVKAGTCAAKKIKQRPKTAAPGYTLASPSLLGNAASGQALDPRPHPTWSSRMLFCTGVPLSSRRQWTSSDSMAARVALVRPLRRCASSSTAAWGWEAGFDRV